MTIKTFALIGVISLGSTAGMARADQMSDLQHHFKDRYPHLHELEQKGSVGETAAGMAECVHPESADADTKKFLQTEDDERTQLYNLIAQQQSTTPDAVAKTSAQRHFDKAVIGEWLKGPDGVWKQKTA